MIKRLRPAYTAAQLKEVYSKPHDANNWQDHLIRVSITQELAKWTARTYAVKSAADLSCGNAAIINSLPPEIEKYLGDFAPGYKYTGALEQTIRQIPSVDLFILSETIEHLDNPLETLDRIRHKTNYLVLSTPDDAGDDTNPEHYWSWDSEDIKYMLKKAGFEDVLVYNKLVLNEYMYDYQIWVVK
jgi:hypothetical protein